MGYRGSADGTIHLRKGSDVTRGLKLVGIILILVVGVIHLFETPEYFGTATYLGVLFALNVLGAVVSAIGIALGAKSWGWTLGALVAAGAFVMYIISRTAGLPALEEAEFFEPLGIASLVVEALFVIVYLVAVGGRSENATS